MSKAQLRAAERYEKDKDAVAERAVIHLMQNVDGRSWMFDLLAEWGAFRTPFSAESEAKTNFNCGTHSAALQIFSAVTTHAPELYLRMVEERKALDDRVNRNDADRRERDDDDGLIRNN